MKIDRLRPDDIDRVVAAGTLFDHQTTPEWAARHLTSDGHHLLLASIDGVEVGFVTGIEMTHPDKGTEMFLYEMGVDPSSDVGASAPLWWPPSRRSPSNTAAMACG